MDTLVEEHDMPSVEAMLAGTLALMTGYSQFLQAALNPAHRLGMGEKITHNLAVLAHHPLLSASCRCVLGQLCERWAVMADCTLASGLACDEMAADEVDGGASLVDPRPDLFTMPAPTTLQ